MSAYLYHIARTPRGAGKSEGALAGVPAIELLKGLLLSGKTLLERASPEDFTLGCVTQIDEQGANLARIAWLYAGLDPAVPGLTLNRFCCSGLDAVSVALGRIHSGDQCALAGGVESTSRVSMFADRGSWFTDPSVSAATGYIPMGVAADLVAQRFGYTRDMLNAWTLRSHQRAAKQAYNPYVVPVKNAQGQVLLERDELIRPELSADKLARLEPAFAEQAAHAGPWLQAFYPHSWNAMHTVANAPAPADGAAIALLGDQHIAEVLEQAPLARVLGVVSCAGEPIPMLEQAPNAVRTLLARHGLSVADIDVFEFNESFAATVLHFRDQLEIDPSKLNPNGGALARGHALGATGVMLLADLLVGLQSCHGRFGVAAICGGAGVATACLIERL